MLLLLEDMELDEMLLDDELMLLEDMLLELEDMLELDSELEDEELLDELLLWWAWLTICSMQMTHWWVLIAKPTFWLVSPGTLEIWPGTLLV